MGIPNPIVKSLLLHQCIRYHGLFAYSAFSLQITSIFASYIADTMKIRPMFGPMKNTAIGATLVRPFSADVLRNVTVSRDLRAMLFVLGLGGLLRGAYGVGHDIGK